MIARTATATLALAWVLSAQEKQEGIAWEPDLATAHEHSAKTGKPVIAYFTFDT